jgi:hypothetical protein
MVEIVKCSNGYIITTPAGKQIAMNIIDMFKILLSQFEGRSETHKGLAYAKVIIETEQLE